MPSEGMPFGLFRKGWAPSDSPLGARLWCSGNQSPYSRASAGSRSGESAARGCGGPGYLSRAAPGRWCSACRWSGHGGHWDKRPRMWQPRDTQAVGRGELAEQPEAQGGSGRPGRTGRRGKPPSARLEVSQKSYKVDGRHFPLMENLDGKSSRLEYTTFRTPKHHQRKIPFGPHL